MKTIPRLGLPTLLASTALVAGLAGCGEDPILLAEIIASERASSDGPPPSPPSVDEPLPEPPVEVAPDSVDDPGAVDPLETYVLGLLSQYCGLCHQADIGLGDFDYVTDLDQMIANSKIVPGNKEDSQIYVRMVEQSMPPSFERVNRPSLEEIELIGAFIDSL